MPLETREKNFWGTPNILGAARNNAVGVGAAMKDKVIEEPAIILAAKNGEVEKVKELAADGNVDLNARDNSGRTALMWAAARGKAEVAAVLIQLGADFNATFDRPVRGANGGIEKIKTTALDYARVLMGDPNNKEDDRNNFSKVISILENKFQPLPIAKIDGISPETKNKIITDKQWLVLDGYITSEYGRKSNENAVGAILNSLDINDQKNKNTINFFLMKAVKNNNLNAVDALVKAGADLSIKDGNDNTPLLMAARNKNIDIFNYIIKKQGTGVEVKNSNDITKRYLSLSGDVLKGKVDELIKELKPYAKQKGGVIEFFKSAWNKRLDKDFYNKKSSETKSVGDFIKELEGLKKSLTGDNIAKITEKIQGNGTLKVHAQLWMNKNSKVLNEVKNMAKVLENPVLEEGVYRGPKF